MPRVDLLGEEALNKVLGILGPKIRNKENLYQAILASDILGNTIYHNLIASTGPNRY